MKNFLSGYLFLFLLACLAKPSFSQNSKQKIDSLYSAYLKESSDTSKVNLLIDISLQYKDKEKVKGISFAREALELSKRINYDSGICYSSGMIADFYYEQLNYVEALKNYLTAAEAGERNKMYSELSKIYNAMGIIYSNQGRYEQSLKYFLKLAKLAEQHNQDKRLAIAYNNIGIAYKDLKRYTEAKKYYDKALGLFEKSGFAKGIGSANSNLGIISHIIGDDESALLYYNKAMEAFRKIKDTINEAGLYTNIGELYRDQKKYQKALEYYNIGLAKAKKYNNVHFTNDAYEGMAVLYAEIQDFKNAYKYHKLHLALSDSIKNEEGMRQVQELERRLETEKQEKEIQILKQNKEIQDLKVATQAARIKKNTAIIYSVVVILAIVVVMSFFIYKAYSQVKRTNTELAHKKKEIQDSIHYAKNIQESMLPDVKILRSYFPEGFGLFLPKDVVSGDFYWFNELNNRLYFAVADCTGHGVPGAFMSMIGIDKLNQSLVDKKIDSLSGILSFLNSGIKKALKQTTDSSLSRDGMDIAICSFDKTTLQLKYAGANRPLWLIRKNEMIEFKPTKASIGGFTDDNQLFQENEIQLQKDDVIYIFSDGFADQFGGPKRKKLMSSQLKKILIENHTLPMSKQELKYKQIFDEWKGTLEQVDDVLLLGIRI
jgi:serine phosphatase RsbU (regulator of sigma subunit)/Flp pilus assembly protein TadD